MKVKIILWCSALLLCVVIINSCENKHGVSPLQPFPSNCDTTNLTYSSGTNNMKPIIDAQCGTSNSSCHATGGSAGSKYDFTTYAGLVNSCQNGTMIGCLFQSNPYYMPKTPQPGWSDSSTCMLGKFKAWINRGYPQ
jgi:hypothetical protein